MPTISDFKAQLRQGGARSNQFTVELNMPPVAAPADAPRAASFLCTAASLPAVEIDPITLMYRGRPVNFAGERRFAPWTVAIINDGDFKVRNALERWSGAIARYDATEGLVNPTDYQVDMRVIQLDRNGNRLKSYVFRDAFPVSVGEMQLDYSNPNIQIFNVTFVYNFYEPENNV